MSSGSESSQQVNANHFLSYDYRASGSILRLQDNTEFYGIGSPQSKRGVIILPDTGGYNAGNIRNIADFIAANNAYVAIPSLLGTPKEIGETKAFTEAHSMGEYTKSQILDGNLKPKVASLARYMFNEGVERIALLGFSWGGWVVTNLLACDDISDQFVCGVLAHPSINLEERMYGGSLVELFAKVKRPLLVLPARGDPHEYDSFVQLLKYRCPSSDLIDYRGYEHNFLLRGRVDDRDIRAADAKALGEIVSYLNYHFNEIQLSDLARDSEMITGQESGTARKRSWREYFEETTQGMRLGMQRTGERAQETWDRTKQGAQEAWDKTKEGAQQTGERAKESWDRTKQGAREGWDKTKEGAQQTGEGAQESWDRTKQGAQEGWDKTKERSQETWDKTKEGVRESEDRAGEATKQTGERMKQDSRSSGRGR